MSQNFDTLRDELMFKRKEIFSEELRMSVGELMNIYQEGEINLEPAFQRLFRWTESQETNFIESLLLGYPIPPLFVIQRKDGIWDVIDGVQRLSTIFHFTNILEVNGNKQPKLQLKKAEILTALEGLYYTDDDNTKAIDSATKIDFRRAGLTVVILKQGSDPKSKFHLFKRLNTGGSHLSDQEMRNAMILMYNENFFNSMNTYSGNKQFKSVLNLSILGEEERSDMDAITRFLIIRNFDKWSDYNNSYDLNVFLDEAIEDIILNKDIDIDEEINILETLINFLYNDVQKDFGFRIYDKEKGSFKNSFNWYVFETIVWGLTKHNDINKLLDNKDNKLKIIEIIKSLESIQQYALRNGKANVRPIERMKIANLESERIFVNEFNV